MARLHCPDLIVPDLSIDKSIHGLDPSPYSHIVAAPGICSLVAKVFLVTLIKIQIPQLH